MNLIKLQWLPEAAVEACLQLFLEQKTEEEKINGNQNIVQKMMGEEIDSRKENATIADRTYSHKAIDVTR
jgi:hypothetical protein